MSKLNLDSAKLEECRNVLFRFFQFLEEGRQQFQTEVLDVIVAQNERDRAQAEQQNSRQQGRKQRGRKAKNPKSSQSDNEPSTSKAQAQPQPQPELSCIREEEEEEEDKTSEPYRKSRRIAAKRATKLACQQLNQSLNSKLRNPGPSMKGHSSTGHSTSYKELEKEPERSLELEKEPEKRSVALPECVVKLSRCSNTLIQQHDQLAESNTAQDSSEAPHPAIPEIWVEGPSTSGAPIMKYVGSDQSHEERSTALPVDESKSVTTSSSSKFDDNSSGSSIFRAKRVRSVNKKYNNDDFVTSAKGIALPKTSSVVTSKEARPSKDIFKHETADSNSFAVPGPSTSSVVPAEPTEGPSTEDCDARTSSEEEPRRVRTKNKKSKRSRKSKMSRLAKESDVGSTDRNVCAKVIQDENNEKENREIEPVNDPRTPEGNLESPVKPEATPRTVEEIKKARLLLACSATSEKKLKPLLGGNTLVFSPFHKGGVLLKNFKPALKKENVQTPLQKTLSAQKCDRESKQVSEAGPSRIRNVDSAITNKQRALTVYSTTAKQKREEKEQRRLNMQLMLAQKEQERVEKLMKEKLEKEQRVERARKLKEEQVLLKKQNTEAALKEAEERRLREEEAKQARFQKLEEEKKKKEQERLKMAEQAKKMHELRQAQEAKEKQIQASLKKAEKKIEKVNEKVIEASCSGTCSNKKPQLKNEDDYGLSDVDGDESTDDESDPRKPIPKWARKPARWGPAKKQACIESVFVCRLLNLFVQTDALTESNPRCRKRASSANWDSPKKPKNLLKK